MSRLNMFFGKGSTLVNLSRSALVVFMVGACSDAATSSPSVSVISLSPSPCGITRTDSVQMSAMATYPDGTKEEVRDKSGIVWSTGNVNTATVSQTGIVVGVSAGITSISAFYEGATGSVDCAVSL